MEVNPRTYEDGTCIHGMKDVIVTVINHDDAAEALSEFLNKFNAERISAGKKPALYTINAYTLSEQEEN